MATPLPWSRRPDTARATPAARLQRRPGSGGQAGADLAVRRDPVDTAPYVGLSIVNDGGNKLDYYLDRS